MFTYDVVYKASDIRWATRWDTYLLATDDQVGWPGGGGWASSGYARDGMSRRQRAAQGRGLLSWGNRALASPPSARSPAGCAPQVHWFSIINSLMIVLFLR